MAGVFHCSVFDSSMHINWEIVEVVGLTNRKSEVGHREGEKLTAENLSISYIFIQVGYCRLIQLL